MNVAVVNIASRALLEELRRYKPEAVIYRKLQDTKLPQDFPGITWIDYSADLSESINYSYLSVRNRLEKIRQRAPGFFRVGEFDFFEALNKDLYWATFDYLLADYALSKIKQARIVYDYRKTSALKGWISLLAFIPEVFADLLKKKNLPALNARGKVAIRVNNPGVIPLLGKLPDVLGKEHFFYYASNHLQFRGQLQKDGVADLTYARPFSPGSLLRKIGGAVRFGGITQAAMFLRRYRELLLMVTRYEHLCAAGPKTILVNACENDGEGNILSQVARRHGVRSANFMNGTKAFDIVNQHTQFDKWFMHDEEMQRQAALKYELPVERLPVTGHLLEDVAMNYRYSGLLDRFAGDGKMQFVVALFTSPLFFEENFTVYAALQRFLEGKNDVRVFIKPHPRDKEFLWDKNDPRLVRLDFGKEQVDNERVLFDLLSRSDVAISIASTVSYQAAWFSIPSLTFELGEMSRLPLTDGVRVQHVNDAEKLVRILEQVYAAGRKKMTGWTEDAPEYKVAKRMAAFLNN